jgi:hypothetical protein
MNDISSDKKFSLRPATVEDDPAIRGLVHIGRINPTGLDWRRFIVAVAPMEMDRSRATAAWRWLTRGRRIDCGRPGLAMPGVAWLLLNA